MSVERIVFPLLVALIATPRVVPMSIENYLVTSASTPEALDFFHAMPDGEIQVLQELDMMLTLDQYKQLYTKAEQGHGRNKRKATTIEHYLWTNHTVFYEIDDSISPSDKPKIHEAIAEWQKYTCLTFEENRKVKSRVVFINGSGCASNVGSQGKIQNVVLGKNCLQSKGVIVHEIGHAIGWYHEHMRPDRDKYITIHHELMEDDPNYSEGLKKYADNKINTYNIPYDYTSVMHYGSDLHRGSIKVLDDRYKGKIGQRIGLSFKDIKLANVMYNCAADVCRTTPFECGKDGLQLSQSLKNRSACECWCDSGDLFDPLKPCKGSRISTKIPNPSVTRTHPISKPKKECKDRGNFCKRRKGKCMGSPQIRMKCPKTCGMCEMQLADEVCEDLDPGCAVMAMAGFHKERVLKDRMGMICKASSGYCKRSNPCHIRDMMDRHNKELNHGTKVAAMKMASIAIFPTCVIVLSMVQNSRLFLW